MATSLEQTSVSATDSNLNKSSVISEEVDASSLVKSRDKIQPKVVNNPVSNPITTRHTRASQRNKGGLEHNLKYAEVTCSSKTNGCNIKADFSNQETVRLLRKNGGDLKEAHTTKQNAKAEICIRSVTESAEIDATNSGDVHQTRISKSELRSEELDAMNSNTLRLSSTTPGALSESDVDLEGIVEDDTFIEVDDNAITPEHLQTKWWIKELHLAISDRNALLSGGEHTDFNVNASQWLLAHQYPQVKGFQDTFHSQLLSFSSARRNEVQIFHIRSCGHWVCTSTVDSPTEVKLYDSIGSSTSLDPSLILQIAQVYNTGNNCKSILPVRRTSVQQQRGSVDCGLFAVAFATEICQGRNPCNTSFDQDRMRVHLYNCFKRGEISSFPPIAMSMETLPRQKSQLFSYSIHCMPDEYDTDMIQCRQWVHYSCAGIVDSTVDSSFSCSVCKGIGRHVAGKPKDFSPCYPAKKSNKEQ